MKFEFEVEYYTKIPDLYESEIKRRRVMAPTHEIARYMVERGIESIEPAYVYVTHTALIERDADRFNLWYTCLDIEVEKEALKRLRNEP